MSNPAVSTTGPEIPESFIDGMARTDAGLEVVFAGADTPVTFSWFWLRDHGVDEASLDPVTFQRRVDTFGLATDITPVAVHIDAQRDEILIDWADAPQTKIPGRLLARALGLTPETRDPPSTRERVLWGKDAPLTKMPSVAFERVMSGDDGLREWLENIVQSGFSLVTGVPSTEEATRQLAERIGRIEETIFGGMWMLSAELKEHDDSAYSMQYLEPHTDSSYYHDAPGLQMFNCLEFDGKGGESVQVDGFAIAERIRREDPEAWQTLTEVAVPAHYLERGVHLRAERPALRLNSKGDLVQVTFNNYDRAPFHLDAESEHRFYRAYSLYHEHGMDQANWLKIPLRPGMVLIFDNWRNLHGRMGYVGKRVFCGCYMNRAEFESRLRLLVRAD
jgi:trimethyllysine dioxygenase